MCRSAQGGTPPVNAPQLYRPNNPKKKRGPEDSGA
jgi:hypothetical protein